MMDAGYMATMEGLLTWPVFGIIVLSILVGSILGALLGMKLMGKHFVKAGLAQCGAYLIATTSVSQLMAALERMGAPRSFSVTLAVTLRFLPALRQDFRHIRDAMVLRHIRGFEEKLECIYVPMLMGAAQTAEELSESATARGIECPGKMSSWRPRGALWAGEPWRVPR